MSIKYPIRSEFIEALRVGIKIGRSRLEGRPIEIRLKPGAYQAKSSMIVSPDDPKEFKVIATMNDPTRFPQRIRVAAWALFLEKIFGRFIQ